MRSLQRHPHDAATLKLGQGDQEYKTETKIFHKTRGVSDR